MGKAGRKRNATAKRETSGKVQRPASTEKEQKILSVALNQPHRRELANPRDERATDLLGHLAITKRIQPHQYEAGLEWQKVVTRWRRAIEAPSPDPISGGGNYIHERIESTDAGVGSGYDTRSHEERYAAAVKNYQNAFVALRDAGRTSLMAVNAVCRDGKLPEDMKSLEHGLNALARYFGIQHRSAA